MPTTCDNNGYDYSEEDDVNYDNGSDDENINDKDENDNNRSYS